MTTFSDCYHFAKEFKTSFSLPQGRSLFDIFNCCIDGGCEVLKNFHAEGGDVEESVDKWSHTSDRGPLRGS